MVHRRILVVTLFAATGCQGGFNPLVPYGATKVPPPATGTIGRSESYLGPGVPGGGSGIERTGRLPNRSLEGDRAWRPTEPGGSARVEQPARASLSGRQAPIALDRLVSSEAPVNALNQELSGDIQLSSRLTWLDPRRTSADDPSTVTASSALPSATRASSVPRLLSVNPSPVRTTPDPLVAPPPSVTPANVVLPRVRGFPSASSSPIDPLQPVRSQPRVGTAEWISRR